MTRVTAGLEGSSGSLEDLARAIEKGEIDPLSISIRDAILSFLEGARNGKKLSLDDAGAFIAAASALIHAKSRALLPPEREPEPEDPAACSSAGGQADEDRDEADCNEALVARLMEYRVFKRAIEELAGREEAWRAIHVRGSLPPGPGEAPPLPEVGLGDLVAALRGILEGVAQEEPVPIPDDDLAIEERMEGILSHLRERGQVTFGGLFRHAATRIEVIATFLALLELMRLARVAVRQESRFGQIVICAAPGVVADGV